MGRFYDVCIVGGGAVGASVAYHLGRRASAAALPPLSVCVIERDPTLAACSSSLSVGGLRYQFSNAANVRMSQYGRQFLAKSEAHLGVDVALTEAGYLFLAGTAEGAATLHANHAVQSGECGADVELLPPAEIRERFPWLGVDDIQLGAMSTSEGYFDPYLLTTALAKKAWELGAARLVGEVTAVDMQAAGAGAGARRAEGVVVTAADGSTERIGCRTLVNACGPWAGKLAALCEADVPVRPRKRNVFQLHCPDARYAPSVMYPDCPLVVDPSGVYVRGDGRATNAAGDGGGAKFLCGSSPMAGVDEDPDEPELEVEHAWYVCETAWRRFLACCRAFLAQSPAVLTWKWFVFIRFEEKIWERLAERAPCFENVKVVGAWAGYYDYCTFDQNGFIGYHSEVENLLLACGFSGHGIQQAPAAGRGVSELLLDGEFTSLDLGCFGYERYVRGEQLLEKNIV